MLEAFFIFLAVFLLISFNIIEIFLKSEFIIEFVAQLFLIVFISDTS